MGRVWLGDVCLCERSFLDFFLANRMHFMGNVDENRRCK